MNMGNGTKHHMWMFFHVQPADTVLFSFWNVENVSGMLVACFILLCLALIFEVLKWLRVVLEQRRTMWPGLLADTAANNYARALFAPGHLAQTGLYFLQLLLSYVLMLAVMTFSVWILFAISGGADRKSVV